MRAGPSRDDGFATAEFAVALPAVVLVLAFVTGMLQGLIVHHRALHAASVGARMAARGDPDKAVVAETTRSGPTGAKIGMQKGADMITVRVTPRVPAAVAWAVPDLTGQVTALREDTLAQQPDPT